MGDNRIKLSDRLPKRVIYILSDKNSSPSLRIPSSEMTSSAARRLAAIKTHTHNPLNSSQTENLVLFLSSGEKVASYNPKSPKVTSTHLLLDSVPISSYRASEAPQVSLDITNVGTQYEETAQHLPRYSVLEISTPKINFQKETNRNDISIEGLWITIYSLFTIYPGQEHIPVIFSGVENAEQLRRYLLTSGLGRRNAKKHTAPWRDVVHLSREGFWQGAGIDGYHNHGWLQWQSPIFPSLPGFTRTSLVIASNPLRPQKPEPGQLLYRRWCAGVGQAFEITHLDLEGVKDTELFARSEDDEPMSKHLAAFHKWHNDDRVNSAWGEKGPLETHIKYLRGVLDDPSVLPCMMSWDGELMGYLELTYAKENHVAQHYPAGTVVGEWERGMHVLNGEMKFAGRGVWHQFLHC